MARKEETVQRSIAWPKHMYEAIVRQAQKRNIPIAAYIRYATEQLLQADGEEIRDDLLWGGFRYSEPESGDESPEGVGAIAELAA